MGYWQTDAIRGVGFSGPIILCTYTKPSRFILWLVSYYGRDYVSVLLLLFDSLGGEANMVRGNRVEWLGML